MELKTLDIRTNKTIKWAIFVGEYQKMNNEAINSISKINKKHCLKA